MPDLKDQRISADTGLDPGVEAKPLPGLPDPLLARFPFLEGFEWTQLTTDTDTACVPAVKSARPGQRLQPVIETGLVVDLVGREVCNHVLDRPSPAMARSRPAPDRKSTRL